MRPLAVCTILLSLACSSQAQKKSLETFVAGRKPELAGDAPLLYLDGAKVFSTENTLASFNRKVVTQGSLKAIVPTNMVLIDDSFSKKPDLYDGLDMRTKVTYLLSILDTNQMKVAATKGIGFGDLNQQEKLVLNSIIPKRFHVQRQETDKEYAKPTDNFYLTDQQRLKVRLKITKSIAFQMHLVDQPNSYTQADTTGFLGTQNLSGFSRIDDEQRSGPDEIFGVKVRQIVPNKLKASDLDDRFASLNVRIKIAAPTTIAQICDEIRRSSGVSIIPDVRVAQRRVSLLGSDVRVGDLLPAMAMMVTGTYRRVGPDFVLTSDLIGLGTRKLRFDQWEADIRAEVEKMTPDWYKQIEKSQALTLAQTSPYDLIQPTRKLNEYLEKSNSPQGFRTPMPDDLIDSNVRDFVGRFNAMYKSQPVSTKGIVANSQLNYNFTMPDGQDILEYGQIGPFMMFTQDSNRRPTNDGFAMKVEKKISPESGIGLVVRLDDVVSGSAIVTHAGSIGFKELWVETTSAEVLKVAIAEGKKSGMQIRLAVRPWLNRSLSEESDRTVLGDTADSLSKWISTNERHTPKDSREFFRSKLLPENAVSPDFRPSWWQPTRTLAATPGLAGVVMMDLQPAGYEPKVGEGQSFGNGPSDLSPRYFGYSTSMRSAFLRKYSVDPIDLVPKGLYSVVNVNPYFFADMELMGFPRTYGAVDGEEYIIAPFVERWHEFKAATMKDGIRRITSELLSGVQIPVWSDVLVNLTNRAVTDSVPLTDYSKMQEFMFDTGGAGAPFGAMVQNPVALRYVVTEQKSTLFERMMILLSQPQSRARSRMVCYDLSRLKDDEVTKFLEKWFEPKAGQ